MFGLVLGRGVGCLYDDWLTSPYSTVTICVTNQFPLVVGMIVEKYHDHTHSEYQGGKGNA